MGTKGVWQRKRTCSQQEWDDEYARIFNKTNKEEECHETTTSKTTKKESTTDQVNA